MPKDRPVIVDCTVICIVYIGQGSVGDKVTSDSSSTTRLRACMVARIGCEIPVEKLFVSIGEKLLNFIWMEMSA